MKKSVMKLTLGLFVLLLMLSPAAWAVSEHEGDQVDEEVQSTLYTPLDGGTADGQLLDFAGAWQLAAAEGGSVTLQQDVLVAAEDAPGDIFVQVPEDGEVLLDLNGHRLEGEEVPCLIYVGARGKLTVTDGGQSGSQIIGVVGVDESADDPAEWGQLELLGDAEVVDPNVMTAADSQAEYTPAGGGTSQPGTFAATWNKAATNGGSVKLLQDVTAENGSFGTGDGFDNGAIMIPEGTMITLDLNGKNIDRGLTEDQTTTIQRGKGSVIFVSGTLNLKDSSNTNRGTIKGGKENYNPQSYEKFGGGGVYVAATGTLNMSGGTISGNQAYHGGGVYVVGTFNMTGGVIASNISSCNGGGVFLDNGATNSNAVFDMQDGLISKNEVINDINSTETCNGGGVYIAKRSSDATVSAKFTMSGGEISGNKSKSTVTGTGEKGSGGGVCVGAYNTFEMSGGKISSNEALSGAGVMVYGTATINNGEISGNTATYDGGGVEIADPSYHAAFKIQNTVITNNEAGRTGGGIFSGSTFDVSGKVSITGNKKSAAHWPSDAKPTVNNVHLASAASIHISGTLSEDSAIRVLTYVTPTSSASVLVAQPAEGVTANLKNFAYDGDNTSYSLAKDNGNIVLKNGPAPHSHELNIGCDSTITAGAEEVEFTKKLSSDSSKQLCVDGSVAVIDQYDIDLYNQGTTYVNSCYFLPEGEYYLAEDIVVDKPIVVQGNVKLCLNGNIIQGYNLDYSLMFVAPNAVLDLCDCNPETTHTGFDEITVTGGILTGGNAHRTESRPSTAYSHGGGINVYGSTLNMYGGTIYKNRAIDANGDAYHEGGGIYCSGFNSGSDHYTVYFNMYGGAIIGNSACNGGGVYFSSGNDAEFNMYGGIIEGNTANINGAGVYNASNFIMHGGEIRDNRAEPYKSGYGGDGAGVLNTGRFTMKGGVITGNIAKRNGGGVYHTKNDNWPFPQSFTVSGNPQIYDNIGTYYQIPDDFYSAKGYIMIDNSGLEDGAKIGVRKDPNQTTNRMVAALFDEQAGYNSEYLKYFFADESNKYHIEATNWTLNRMCLKLVDGAAHEHNGTTFNTSFNLLPTPLPAGDYYLTADTVLDDTVIIDGSVSFCLNGHKITGPSDGTPAFSVPNGAALTIYNEEGAGNFAGLSGSGGIEVAGGGSLNLVAQTAADNKTYAPAAGSSGGRVTVGQDGTVTKPDEGGEDPAPGGSDHKTDHPDPDSRFQVISADNFDTVTQAQAPADYPGVLPAVTSAYRFLNPGQYYLKDNFKMSHALIALGNTDFCLNGSNLGADNDTWIYEMQHVFWVPEKTALNVLDCQRNLHIVWLYGGRVFLKNGAQVNISGNLPGYITTIEMGGDADGEVTVKYVNGDPVMTLPKGAALTQQVPGKPDQTITNHDGVLEMTTPGAGAPTTRITPPSTEASINLKLPEPVSDEKAPNIVLVAPADSTVQTGNGPEIKLEQPGEVAADGTVSSPEVTVTTVDPATHEEVLATVTAPAGESVQVNPDGEVQAPQGSTVQVDGVAVTIEEIDGGGTDKTLTVRPSGEIDLPSGSKVTASTPEEDGVSIEVVLPGDQAEGTLNITDKGIIPPAGSSVSAKTKDSVEIVIALPDLGGGEQPEIKFGDNGALVLPPETELSVKTKENVEIVIALPDLGGGEQPEVKFGDNGALVLPPETELSVKTKENVEIVIALPWPEGGEQPEIKLGDDGTLILPPGTQVTKDGKTETVEENNVLDPDTGELTGKEPENPDKPEVITPGKPIHKPDATVEMDDKGEITVTPADPKKPPVVIKPQPQDPDKPEETPKPPVVDETGKVVIDAPFKVETGDGPDITAEKGGSVDPDGNVTGETVTVEQEKPDGTTENTTLTAPENDVIKVSPDGEAQAPVGTEVKRDDVKVKIDEVPDPAKPVPVKPDGSLDLPGGSKITVTPEKPQQPDQNYTVTIPEQGGEVKLDQDKVILPPGATVVDNKSGKETAISGSGGTIDLSTGKITGAVPTGGDNDHPGGNDRPGGGSGGSDRPTSYVIMASASIGGEIIPDKRVTVRSGANQTFTIKPAEGYVISDVLVDDVSVGPVPSYTFKNVHSEHTIQALFVAEGISGHGHQGDCPRDETCPIWPYTDAVPTDWYHDGVHYCIENGLMIGTAPVLWEPDIPLSRAMMAQVLYNKAGQPAVSGEGVFDDVDQCGYWPAITWGGRNNVLLGYRNGNYGPYDSITREQLATLLWRYAGQPQASGQLHFSDAAEVSDYAKQALIWASQQGIIAGYPDGTFRPQDSTSRAEAAQMIMRYFNL